LSLRFVVPFFVVFVVFVGCGVNSTPFSDLERRREREGQRTGRVVVDGAAALRVEPLLGCRGTSALVFGVWRLVCVVNVFFLLKAIFFCRTAVDFVDISFRVSRIA